MGVQITPKSGNFGMKGGNLRKSAPLNLER
jgi:hypothetical protein